MIMCGPGEPGDQMTEILAALETIPHTPGWRFRAHPNHFPQFERTEAEAYVPMCCCGAIGPNTSDIGESAAWFSTHLDDLTDQPRREATHHAD